LSKFSVKKSLASVKGIHPKYLKYLKFRQDKVKPSTFNMICRMFSKFPKPDGLTYEWLAKQIKRAEIDKNKPKPKDYISIETLKGRLVHIKHFCEWDGRDTEFITRFKKDYKKRLKAPEGGTTVTPKDLYTPEELDRLWKVLSGRDLAMIKVLYESGCRASELLSIQVEDIKHGTLTLDNGGTLSYMELWIKESKTKERYVRIYKSVPLLKEWLSRRRMYLSNEGPLWIRERAPYEPLARTGLDLVVRRGLKRAGITGKKKILHMFRHTRVTELKRGGVSDSALCDYFGWRKGSDMPSRYAHLTREDSQNEIDSIEITGGVTRAPAEPLLKMDKCPYCKAWLSGDREQYLFCPECEKPLDDESITKILEDYVILENRIAQLESTLLQVADKMRKILVLMEEDVDTDQILDILGIDKSKKKG